MKLLEETEDLSETHLLHLKLPDSIEYSFHLTLSANTVNILLYLHFRDWLEEPTLLGSHEHFHSNPNNQVAFL